MPTYQLTSPRTGRTYGVQAAAELPDDDIDALVNDLDFEAAREAGVQPGVDPAVLQQGPLGSFAQSIPQTFSKVGSGMIGGAGRILDKASESLSQATGLPKGGDMFQRMADYGDELSTSADLTFPTNPQNPVAGTIGSGAAQGLSLLAGGLAGKALTGSNVAMTAVPAVSGFLSGANEGIQQAERIGVQSPLAQLGTGLAFGGVEVLTERLGGIGSKAATEALTQAVRQTAGQMMKKAGKAVGSEAFEEVLAGRSQAALTRLIASEDPANPGFTTTGVKLDDLAREIVNLEAMKLEALGGAAGGTVFAGVQALANRQFPNDPTTPPNQTPAPTQAPAPGQPGAPAPMGAGAPGAAAVSPLIGIAQRGGAVDVTLREDTGELTAEEVQDLETGRLGDGETETVPTPGAGAIRPQPGASRVTEEGSIPSTAPQGAERVISTGRPNGAQVSAVIDFVEAADLEPLLLREVGTDQTRDRANNRGSSEQIASIATAPDAQLLGDSPVSSLGAPVVDDVILAGNGRAEGLLQGYRTGGAGIANYRQQIVQQAAAQGRTDVAGMRQPVMIRRVTGYVRGDRRSFVTESNPKYATLQETVAEAALLDAEVLGDMSGIEFTQSGQLTSSSLQQVATKLKAAQRGVNATTGGKPDVVEGTRRVQLASLAKLAKDNGVDVSELSGLLETDTGRRAIAEVTKAAPRLAALDADLGLGDVMLSALRSFSEGARAVSQGIFKNLTEWADNRGQELIRDDLSPEAGQILEVMIETVRTPTKLRELFDTYLEAATNEQDQRNQAAGTNDIFGDARTNVPGTQILGRQLAGATDATPAPAERGSGQSDAPVASQPPPLMLPSNRLGRGLADMMPGGVPSSRSQVPSSSTILTPKQWAQTLPDSQKGTGIPNQVTEPTSGNFKEGKLTADQYGDDPYIYQDQWIQVTDYDPRISEDVVGLEGVPYETVAKMPTTQQYIEWYQQGKFGPPITIVQNQITKRGKSNNRRRIVAALEAGIQQIPARVEIGRASEIMGSQTNPSQSLPVSPSPSLATAYTTAARGQSSQMLPLAEVFAAAQQQNPALTPAQFQAQVMAEYEAGTVLLEGSGSRQEAESAALRIDGTPVGTAVRMMVTEVPGSKSQVPSSGQLETSNLKPETSPQGFTNLNPGARTGGFLNAEILAEGAALLQQGFTTFANWSKAMLSRFGQGIRDALTAIWQQITSPQTNAAQNVRMGRAQGSAPVTMGQGGFVNGPGALNFTSRLGDQLQQASQQAARPAATAAPLKAAKPPELGERWWATTTRAEARSVLEPAALEELKAIAVRMDENPNQPKAKLIDRLVQITGVYADAVGIRGADAVGPRGTMPDYTGQASAAQQRMREQRAARAQQPKERGLPKKAKPRTPEEFARDMAALMARPATGGKPINLSAATAAPLKAAYASALRGSSTAMIPLAEVFAAAQAANPTLTQEQFQAQVMVDYEAGSLMLEGAGSPQEAAQAGMVLPGTPVGTAVRMMVTEVPGSKSQVPSSGQLETSNLKPETLESPASLAANQKANESILRNLGLPTAKGTRVWGGKKIQAALAKLATDERYPATTRRMAQELAARPLDNLLLKIEADARLNWAGLYQPFNDGRGELSLNTRTMGRGELDIGISLVHEVLHHATYQALRNPKTARQKQAAKDLRALYTRAKAALAANEQFSQFDYELSSVDEFITGLWTRADFQTALAGIPADAAPTLGQRVRSMLDEIFRVLSELVTGKAVPPGSVLEASMAASLRIMEDGRTQVEYGANAGDPLQNPAFRLAARVLPLHERGEPFRVKQLGTRAILTGSPLPSDVTQVLAMTENERQAVAQAAAQVGNDLQAAVKAYLDRTGQDERATWDKINAVMEGQPGALTLLTAIDPALGERSRRARNMLDDLSAAVAQTLPTGSLRDAITQNQGSWMRRGYAAFDPESGWNFDGLTKAAKAGRPIGGKDAAKILADARAYLRTQNPQNGRTLKEWNADIEADMRDLMDRDAWQSANLGGNTLRKNVSSFMRRKDIAPEIRALMGEETNPLHRFVKSAAFQSQIVARHHGQVAVRALGLQTGLFSTQRGGVYTEEIEPSENRWSGLAGVWTTPEMKAALAAGSTVNREGTDIGGWLVGTLKALGNEAKLNRVALNPDSWVVNILGNVVGLVQSGDVFAWDFARRLTDARALIKSGKARPGSMQTAAQSALIDAQRAMLGRLRGMGVLGSSITLADIEASIPRHLLQWVAEDRARNAGLGAVKGAIVGQAAGRGLGVAGRVVGGVAGGIGGAIAGAQRLQNWQQTVADYVMTGPDALARVTGWLTNYETALAAGQNGDQAAASATTKTLNTFPNYNKLPALLRQLSRLGFTGSFIAFQWEVYRNFGWNVKYAIEELGSGNAAIQARGMRRLAGIGSVAALAGGGLAALLSAAGAAGDDDERNKIWRQWFAAPWEKDAVLAFDKYDKEGVSYYNTSYLLPQMTMMELIQGASEGRDPADSASRVVNRLSEQFINGSVHLQPLLSAFANQDRFGRKITNAEGLEGAAARADEAAKVILEPGFADKITRLTYALRGAEKNGRKFSVEEEMKRLAGIRQVSRTWEELVKRRYSKFTYDYQGVRDDANKILGENLPGAPVRAVKMVNDKVIELEQQMADYERDLRRLGVPEATIKAAKKDSSLQRLNPVRVRADGRRVETVTGR